MHPIGSDDLTPLLQRWTTVGDSARSELVARMYPELKRIAENRMRKERGDHTLQATALVSEFFLELARQDDLVWQNRAHFLAFAAQAMKRMLIDYARSHTANKRGGGRLIVRLDSIEISAHDSSFDLLSFNELLDLLWKKDVRMAQVAELRCFGGLTHAEIAAALEIDERTVKRDWKIAKAWFNTHLRNGSDGSGDGLGAN